MITSKGYAAPAAGAPLAPFAFPRREPQAGDVVLEILYCGICHSDLSFVNDAYGMSSYPLVPGHEIVGRVVAVGSRVTKFAVGDIGAIGCYIDSCRHCAPCHDHQEQYCLEGVTPAYGGLDRKDGSPTYGGFSNGYVADEAYVLRVPDGLDPARTAPLLCAGITTYSPLRHWRIGPGHRVGVVGLGGLGHLAIKFARSMGAEVVLFTTSEQKRAEGIALGAGEAVLSTDADQMAAQRGRLDFILDTVSAQHDIDPLMAALRYDGTLCLLGIPAQSLQVHPFSLVMGRRTLAGSNIGGIRETQEMLDYCADHGIGADIELIAADGINDAFARIARSDVRYRFVIDAATF